MRQQGRGRKRLLGETCLACALVTSACGQATPPPNVVLITLDTTRADRLGCYGYAKPTSPRIDAFAAGGTLFRHALSTSSVTPVSHASILTGRYPYSHGLRVLHGRSENVLPEEETTLAEVLKGAGFETAAFVSAFPAGSRFGLDQGFDIFDESFLGVSGEGPMSQEGVVQTKDNQRHAGQTTDLALAWLQQVSGPYLLWVHYFDPHDTHVLPPEDFLSGIPRPVGTLRERLREIYDVELLYMDQQIGRLVDWLEETGDLDRSLLIIVSDHGEGLGDHDWWTHGILYQEQIRVPLIIRAPGQTEAVDVDHLVRTIDITPTVLERVGLKGGELPTMDGRSISSLLDGDAAPDPHFDAYADSLTRATYGFARGIKDVKEDMLFMIVEGRWKYIHHLLKPEESELYDLDADPGETINLHSSHPDRAQRMLENLLARDAIPDSSGETHGLSEEDLERLRSLGYVQ